MRDFHRLNKLHPKDVQSKLQDYRRISTENKVSCALKKTSALFLINYRSVNNHFLNRLINNLSSFLRWRC